MESKIAYSPIIKNLNSFQDLYRSMNKLTLETRLDEQRMVFIPFSAKGLPLNDNEINDYYTLLKNEELEKITKLFSNTINNACNEHLDGNLNINLFHDILDRIEKCMPDVKDALENLVHKTPALAGKVKEFILQHKDAMRIANNISDNMDPMFVGSSKMNNYSFEDQKRIEISKKVENINSKLNELGRSVDLLKYEHRNLTERSDKTLMRIRELESAIAQKCVVVNIHNSVLPLSRTLALELLNLSNINIKISDEDLIVHLEEHAKIHDDSYILDVYEGSTQRLIDDIKTSLQHTKEHESMKDDLKRLNEEVSPFQHLFTVINNQINVKEAEQKALQGELQLLK